MATAGIGATARAAGLCRFMAKAFISAANTVLGVHLARHLTRCGWSVVAQVMPGSDAGIIEQTGAAVVSADLSLRWVPMDILPRDVDVIFHFHDWDMLQSSTPERLSEQLVHGTHGLLVAAADTQCGIVIHQSPAHVYSSFNGHAFTESDAEPVKPDRSLVIRLAQQAERRVRHSGQRGLKTLVVNTGVDLGPGSLSGWMGLVPLIEARRLTAMPRGNAVICDPAAVAVTLTRLARTGQNGDHFLLGGEAVELRSLIGYIADRLGVAPPGASLFHGKPGTKLLGALSRRLGLGMPGNAAAMIGLLDADCLFDDSRARNQLGYAPRAIDSVIDEAIAWYLDDQFLVEAP